MRQISIRYLVVGGGGAAGGDNNGNQRGAGGGGGQVVDASVLLGTGTYNVTIGPGGSGVGESGNLTSISGVGFALGGGFGGSPVAQSSRSVSGGDNGNGGGASSFNSAIKGGRGRPLNPATGFYGGSAGTGNFNAGGGGAGAGGNGGDAGASNNGGGGGSGAATDINGSSRTFGGGGGGANSGGGGTGGGGAASDNAGTGTSGTANTGGGGGGGRIGGTGGSGIAGIRWNPVDLANAGLTISFSGGSQTDNIGGNNDSYREWTSDGSFTIATRTDYKIAGVVTLGGTPVQNAKIRVINQTNDQLIAEVLTDVDGEYEVLGVSQNSLYHVVVEYNDGSDDYNGYSLWDVTPDAV
jgi:hypothetical protein